MGWGLSLLAGVGEEVRRSSFLKKRTKKLLFLVGVGGVKAPGPD
jgi:hypothetical protein